MREIGSTMPNESSSSAQVAWIGLRPKTGEPMRVVEAVRVESTTGLDGDRFNGSAEHRQVTLFEMEFLDVIAKLMGLDQVNPEQTRRNIGVRGINLHGFMDCELQVGDCRIKITSDCTPCGRMEELIGKGAIAAMAGLAGVTATVLDPGRIRVGDIIRA